jgi:hypothetical protein
MKPSNLEKIQENGISELWNGSGSALIWELATTPKG